MSVLRVFRFDLRVLSWMVAVSGKGRGRERERERVKNSRKYFMLWATTWCIYVIWLTINRI